MKQLFAIKLFFLLSFYSRAQDTLRMHSGEVLNVKVIANKPYSIDFTYPGETSYTTYPKSLVSMIAYSSGRKEKISDLVNITGEEGWKNVIVTMNPEEIVGLVRVQEIRAKANNIISAKSVSGVDAVANERLQKEAATLGAHVILMLQNDTKGNTSISAAQSFKSGVAYRYPFKDIDSKLPYSGGLARRYYGADKSDAKTSDADNLIGQKVLFDYEGEVFEGEIVKVTGKFYKIKFTNKKGKEQTTEKHAEKVEFGKNSRNQSRKLLQLTQVAFRN